jgi:uncharacterized protein (TIGR03437 family)
MSKLFSRNALAVLALVFPAAALAQPVVNAVINNFSGELPGLPSYGIAPASLFVIYGSHLCDDVPLVTQTSAGSGLPTTLNGMSISVIVNGVTTNPAIYYAIPTQVAAVLPSTTPSGSGTITVNYKGSTSAPLLVTKSAFGILTLNLTGAGGVKATNLQYEDITPTASAAPGQTIILWGSGLGADTANDDRSYPMKQDNLKNATVYIGGVKADVLYAGRSLFPGEDQIDVTVPSLGASSAFRSAKGKGHDAASASSLDLQQALNWEEEGDSGFQAGCENAIVVVANGIASNFGTLPVNPGNGVCSDALYGINGTELSQTGSQGTVKGGTLSLFQGTQPAQNSDVSHTNPEAQSFKTLEYASAMFSSTTGASFVGGSSYLSLGNCIVSLPANISGLPGTVNGLDAGTSIGLAGGSLSVQLTEPPKTVGSYDALLTSPLGGGTAYTFTGPGGKKVGPFKVTITFPVPVTWTNKSSISTVAESQGQLITWTGGATGSFMYISGNSMTSPPVGVVPQTVSFACNVPVVEQQFTIPSYVLEALPKGSGQLTVFNEANPVSFSATGLDGGRVVAGSFTQTDVIYQ